MAEKQDPIICPHCHIPMNHHGDKLVDPRGAEDAKRMVQRYDGMIEEIHGCPRCCMVASRPGA